MIKISDLTISFGAKIVFKAADFKAFDNGMTVIKGKSGSGKSTFIKALRFEYDCNYFYNDRDLTADSENQKQEFIYDKISFVDQLPLFLNGMTINEHIELIKKTYQILANEEYIDRFGIRPLLDKYPKELSGGEKTRVAVMLSLLKQPEVLILDEPTAALDYQKAVEMINILKEYGHSGHIVIIASHDKKLIEQSDYLYEIKDNKLLLVNNAATKLTLDNTKQADKYSYQKIKLKFDHKLFRLQMMLLVSVLLVVAVYGFNLFSSYENTFKNKINDISSLELLVYKPKYDHDYFSYAGDEYPFTDKEISTIKVVNHVKDVSFHFDMDYNAESSDGSNDYLDISENQDMSAISLYQNNQTLLDNESMGSFAMHSYNDNADYTSKLMYQFNDRGIIISDSMFQTLLSKGSLNIEKLNNVSLKFILFVPKYDTSNTSQIYLNDEGTKVADVNTVRGLYRYVEEPILGVLKNGETLYGVERSINNIFVSNSDMKKYIEESYPKNNEVSYAVKDDDYNVTLYTNELPQEINPADVIHVINKVAWKPSSFIVTVDSLTNLDKVANELIKNGFAVESEYVDSNALSLLDEGNQNILRVFIVAIIIVVLSFYCYLKYLIFKEDEESSWFLKRLGLTNKRIVNIFYRNYLNNAIIMFLITAVILTMSNEMFVKMQLTNLFIKPQLSYYLAILLVCLIVEFAIPILISSFSKKYRNYSGGMHKKDN